MTEVAHCTPLDVRRRRSFRPFSLEGVDTSHAGARLWVEETAFPATGPEPPTDAAAIRANDQVAFDAVDRLTDTRRVHGVARDAGYVAYHWVLTFHGEHALGELVRRIHGDLAAAEIGAAFEPVPFDRLNLPLVRLGGQAEADGDRLGAIEWAARNFCLTGQALRLAIGPAVGAPGGIRLSVAPWDALTELHHGLRLATREVVGLRPWLRELTPYRPHVTLAYCRPETDLPAAALRPLLEQWRRLPPVRLRVRRVTLVRVAARAGGIDWHTVSSLPLGVRFTL